MIYYSCIWNTVSNYVLLLIKGILPPYTRYINFLPKYNDKLTKTYSHTVCILNVNILFKTSFILSQLIDSINVVLQKTPFEIKKTDNQFLTKFSNQENYYFHQKITVVDSI
ncbi:hypothetical protein [Aquimarina sp. RZ0]|uniref:hypothetical protein n=1 Tax=Aquimarina sp. RZ0 TaxID=2607730 RepID=UPI0011F1CB9B|nr:hypothetical protein [Aquimarina sp. RZ0]KAA1242620.1 hypothetical protein F0000_24790 [Aquimarina sp. RZ0]